MCYFLHFTELDKYFIKIAIVYNAPRLRNTVTIHGNETNLSVRRENRTLNIMVPTLSHVKMSLTMNRVVKAKAELQFQMQKPLNGDSFVIEPFVGKC